MLRHFGDRINYSPYSGASSNIDRVRKYLEMKMLFSKSALWDENCRRHRFVVLQELTPSNALDQWS
jgi:hypothetical protein